MKNKIYQQILRRFVFAGKGNTAEGSQHDLKDDDAMARSLIYGYHAQHGDRGWRKSGRVRHYHDGNCPCEENSINAQIRAGLRKLRPARRRR